MPKHNSLSKKTRELRLPDVPMDVHQIILIEQAKMKLEKGYSLSLTKTLTAILREFSCLKYGENCE